MSKDGKQAAPRKPAPAAAKPCRDNGLPHGVVDAEELREIPGGETRYFPIALGGDTGAPSPNQCPVTGVFIPKGYTYRPTIDVVLFFHGDKQGWKTIEDFWAPGNAKKITLRQAVNDSGKEVILIAPTMGPKPGWSGNNTGDLDTKGADDLLDYVRSSLTDDDPRFRGKPMPEIGRIALAAHSGGGETMLMQTWLMKKYRSNIRALWGFDCTYDWSTIRQIGAESNAGNWVMFASYRPDVQIHLHYLRGSSRDPTTDTETVAADVGKIAAGKAPFPGTTQKLHQPLGNVHVWPSAEDHYAQLNNNFPVRMTQFP